jgi:molecular chaperone GrpE
MFSYKRPVAPLLNSADSVAEKAAEAALQRLLRTLVSTLDSVEAGLESGNKQLALLPPQAESTVILAGWLQGQRLLRDKLLESLAREGLLPIATVGQSFDPYRHVAIGAERRPDLALGTILSERKRGFERNGTVWRYAEVVVSQLG